MTAKVELLTGPARSGKTALLLERYRRVLRENLANCTPGANLWITPTNRSRRRLLSALPDDSLPVFFAPNVFTFDKFADRVLSFSDLNLRPLSESARRLVMASIIDELRTHGQLGYFGSIAETTGFVDLVSSFITELKRNETWPEHFRAACGTRGATDKDRELALIYERYQATLNDHALYDPEGCFWSARNVLKEGGRAPFERLSLVVVDGFADFTRTQYEILAHLAQWADELAISLPQEASNVEKGRHRPDLFAKSTDACERIRDVVGTSIHRIDITDAGPSAKETFPAAGTLAKSLFANPRAIVPDEEALGLEVLAVVGQRGEVRAIAERVKRLLQAGVKPDDVVVAVRSLDDYADLIVEAFADGGIPFHCPPPGTLAQAPVVRALLGVLEMEIENWPFDRVKAVILSNYFRPEWKPDEDAPELVRVVAALRKTRISGEREAFLDALQRTVERGEALPGSEVETYRGAGETDADSASDLDLNRERIQAARIAREAMPVLLRLSDATRRLRTKATFEEWARRVVDLAGDLGMTARSPSGFGAGDSSLSERDAVVWESVREILFDAVKGLELLGLDSEKLALAEFQRKFVDLLSAHRIPSTRAEAGRVLVLEAADVRNLDVPHLFLAGLSEGSFPRARVDDCLYNEAERQRLNESGLGLRHRSGHSRDEMFLFYQIVTRAQRSLVISYPSVSTSGQPLFPSPYVAAVRDLFTEAALPVQQVGRLDPVPAETEMLTVADLRLIATHSVRENKGGWFRTLAQMPGQGATARNILAATDAADARFHQKGFTVFEGSLGETWVREKMAERFPRDYQFSATQLERYAGCAYRFFLSDVLGVEPLESLEARTDYLARGVTVHDVLSSIHQAEDGGANAERSPVDEASIVARFRELVDLAIGRRGNASRFEDVLNQIERDLLHEWGEAYGQQWTSYRELFRIAWNDPPQPTHLEVAFGNAPGAKPERDAKSRGALVFGAGESATRVRGRIDRVDVGSCEGRPVFNVIDYKSGSISKFHLGDVAAGTSLQLALYTVAVLRHQLAGAGATPFQLGFWSLRETGYVSGIKNDRKSASPASPEFIADLERTLEAIVPRLAAGIRSGDFSVNSSDPHCTRFCPYRTVCRIGQLRDVAEPLEKHRPQSVSVATNPGTDHEDESA
ncbi:MAG: PD-(D/E)XK nuclease family protein [Planctomycetaceae bacterium]